MSGTKTIVEAALRAKPVSQEVADARAAICSKCPQNQPVSGCMPCNWKGLSALVKQLVGAKKTKSDALLKNCKACGCINKAQVWVPLDILQKHIPSKFDALLPDDCWKKQP